MYNQKVIEHFTNPRNVGEMKEADGIGDAGSSKCGDTMKIFIKVEDRVIADIKFLTFGCGAAIASSSILTEMVKGLTLEEALKVTNKDVADELGGLPGIKMHCSNIAADALKSAIENYYRGKTQNNK